MVEREHNIDSATGSVQDLAAGGKGGLIDQLLAARGADWQGHPIVGTTSHSS